MSEGIFAGRVEDENRSVADDRGNILIVHGVDPLPRATDSVPSKDNWLFTLDDAIHVTSAFSRCIVCGRRIVADL